MVLDVSFAGNWRMYDRTGSGWDMGHPQDAVGLANQQTAMSDPAFFTNQLPNPFQGILPSTITTRGSNATVSRVLAAGLLHAVERLHERRYRRTATSVRTLCRSASRSAPFGEGSSAGVLTWVLSYTFSKQYFLDCCIGQAWQSQHRRAICKLNVNAHGAVVGNLVTHSESGQPARHVLHAVRFGQQAAADRVQRRLGSADRQGPQVRQRRHTALPTRLLSGWRADYILTYISGNPVGLPDAVNFCGDYVHYKDPATGQPTGQTPDHWFNNNPKCYANFPDQQHQQRAAAAFLRNVENPASAAVQRRDREEHAVRGAVQAAVPRRIVQPDQYADPSGSGQHHASPARRSAIIPNSQQNFPRLVQLAMKLYF